jgi:NADPH2:quinone reductase
MRAVVCREYGPPEGLALEELPDPRPGAGQAVVEVRAAAVNFPDLLILRNRYQVQAPLPFTPGSEFAGVVREVGPGVTRVVPGDRVFGAVFVGAFAEALAVDAAGLTAIPERVDFEAAAAFGVAYGTAWAGLRSLAQLAAGETLVVLGAAGGVGLAAVELGKLLGARVVACASSAEKLAACREAGADLLVDYEAEDLKGRLKELTGGRGADVVFDPVGGRHAEPALRATGWRGRYLVVGFASGEIPKIPLNLVLLKGARILGLSIGPFLQNAPEEARRNREELLAFLAEGRIRPRVGAIFPLEQVARALREVSDRRARGKVLIRPGAPGPGGRR